MGSIQCPYCKQTWQFKDLQEFAPERPNEKSVTTLYIKVKEECPATSVNHFMYIDYDHTGKIISSEELHLHNAVFFTLKGAQEVQLISP